MSDRGSFVTEYIWCDKCFDACKKILVSDTKELKSVIIPSWLGDGSFLPIIAGKIGSFNVGGPAKDIEDIYVPALEKTLCHELKISVIAPSGHETFIIEPNIKGQQ